MQRDPAPSVLQSLLDVQAPPFWPVPDPQLPSIWHVSPEGQSLSNEHGPHVPEVGSQTGLLEEQSALVEQVPEPPEHVSETQVSPVGQSVS